MEKKIHLLEPSIAERIAAGEVIERPASVVKELIENSLDAGATEILVHLEEGGKSLIEVIDNGEGMSPGDLELCIERHATSKLKTLDDLEKIVTLGFRGEALASIGAVSDLTLTSRAKDSLETYELSGGDLVGRIERNPKAQKITFGHFVHSPHGTKITARGLFGQVPARLKFLKSQAAEVSQVRDWMERLALAYPHVGFQLLSNHRVILNLRPQDEAHRIRAVLAEGEDYPLISVSNEPMNAPDGFRDRSLKIDLHWLQGLSSPQGRKVIQIVNFRAVKDRMLQQAILSGFRQALLPGQFPAVLLRIQVIPAAIDVNVHPTKTEIRFLDSRKIFQIIDSLVREMIRQKGAPAIAPISLSPPVWEMAEPSPTFVSPPSSGLSSEVKRIDQNNESSNDTQSVPQGNRGGQHSFVYSPPTLKTFETVAEPSPLDPLRFSRPVGILFNTYLVYENPSELVLVDQHAAHERVQYEKLKKRILGPLEKPEPLSSQALLIPEVIRFPEENRILLQERLSWLAQLGFDVELFSEDTVVFRSVPSEWGTKQLKIRLRNLIERVLTTDVQHPDEPGLRDAVLPVPLLMDEGLFEALASEACHSAIRAGDRLEPREAQELVQQLFRCEHPWNCPHGRPTVVKVPQGKLEEWFQRKV